MSFPETQWSELAAATLNGCPAGRRALDRMCVAYRPCLLLHLRLKGVPDQEAEDLVQETFQVLLFTRAWSRANPQSGKFRSFLLGILQHVRSRRYERAQADKRGGGCVPLSLEQLLEDGYEPVKVDETKDLQYDREWALRLIESAMESLMNDWKSSGKDGEFRVLRHFLPGALVELSYEEAAEALSGSVAMVKSAVHRLRAEFRQALRRAVAQTVSAPHEIDEEMQYLREILSKPD